MKNHIGTVLQFQQSDSIKTIMEYTPVLQAVNNVAKAYEDLDTTFHFTQEIFEDILTNDIANITKTYAAKIEEQIISSKFTSKAIINSMRENVPVDLAEITKKITALREIQQRAASSISSYPVEFEYIKIHDGKAMLSEQSKEAIREFFTIKIRTEEQSKLYNLLLALKEKFEDLTSFMQENGIDLSTWGEIIADNRNGLCYENNGKLEIDPTSITIKLKQHGSAEKQQLLEA